MSRAAKETCYWDAMDSPLGRIHIGARENGALLLLNYGEPEEHFLCELESLGRPVRSAPRLADAIRQLDAYFAGDLDRFELDVDLSHRTPFQQEVLACARNIPYGVVTTYGQVAKSIGRPRAGRAVGGALGSNPIAIVVPCHRVLAGDGSLGGYSGPGGIRTKQFLLDLERNH